MSFYYSIQGCSSQLLARLRPQTRLHTLTTFVNLVLIRRFSVTAVLDLGEKIVEVL